MILLADNDIVLKLAGCHLLDDFISALTLADGEIFITQDARFSLVRQAEKNLAAAPELISRVHHFVGEAKFLEQAVNGFDDLLDRMAGIDGIDSGEAILFLAAHQCQNSKLATGDKRSLRALLNFSDDLAVIVNSLQGRVYTLESSLLMLIQRLGYEHVNRLVSAKVIQDKTLGLAFGFERSEDHAIACLSSESRPFLSLLANAGLVQPLE